MYLILTLICSDLILSMNFHHKKTRLLSEVQKFKIRHFPYSGGVLAKGMYVVYEYILPILTQVENITHI